MNIIKLLKKVLRPLLVNLDLKYLDLNVEPSVNSPLVVWDKWIELADWQKVYKCWKDVDYLVDDFGNALYGGTVRELLEQRLAQIQSPVLCDAFFAKHHNVLVVQSGCDREEILHGLALQMTRKMRPQFVVDDAHKLVGFALSPQLIIAGVSALGVWPSNAAAIVDKNGFSFLSQSEAKCVTRQKDILCEMMREAGVPDISQLEGFPLNVNDDDWNVQVWYFEADVHDNHLKWQSSNKMRFLAKI